MPVLFFLFVKVVAAAIQAIVRRPRAMKPQTLCANCSNAHMQYGANGRHAISCTFGGTIRPIGLDVLYCTDYLDRTGRIPTVRIGFVQHSQSSEAEA